MTAARAESTFCGKPTAYVDFSSILHVAVGGLPDETLNDVAVALTAPSASASALGGAAGITSAVVLVGDLFDAFFDGLDDDTRGSVQWLFVFEASSDLCVCEICVPFSPVVRGG